jgi:isopenicillin N synthase-like dioxygenase
MATASPAASLSFPVINMEKLETEERGAAMEVIRDACENWGFFEVPLPQTHILNCRMIGDKFPFGNMH